MIWEDTSMSTLLQSYDVRKQLLQSYMTIEGFNSLIEDARRDLSSCENSGERNELRSVIEWAREGKYRMTKGTMVI